MNKSGWIVLLLLLAFAPGFSQMGRYFVSIEAFVGFARVVHVGKIVELQPVEEGIEENLTAAQEIGNPYELIFEVSETIRGKDRKRLKILLSLQSTHLLEFMRDHSTEILLIAGPNRFSGSPGPKVGISEMGKRVDGDYYHFRLLDPIPVPAANASETAASLASQINQRNDSGRMFTHELDVVSGRESILERARAFAKKHPEVLPTTTLAVPNEFGALVGNPNAYCEVVLPVCPVSKKTLEKVSADPGLFLRRAATHRVSVDSDSHRERLRKSAEKALAEITANLQPD